MDFFNTHLIYSPYVQRGVCHMATSDIRQQKLEIIESSRQQERSKCLHIAFHSISQAVISEYCSFSKLSRCAIQGTDFSRLNQGREKKSGAILQKMEFMLRKLRPFFHRYTHIFRKRKLLLNFPWNIISK